jgi:hypothetical protein
MMFGLRTRKRDGTDPRDVRSNPDAFEFTAVRGVDLRLTETPAVWRGCNGGIDDVERREPHGDVVVHCVDDRHRVTYEWNPRFRVHCDLHAGVAQGVDGCYPLGGARCPGIDVAQRHLVDGAERNTNVAVGVRRKEVHVAEHQ